MRPDRRFWIELSYRYSTPISILQKLMTQRDFIELQAEELLCPRGPFRDNWNAAIVARAMAGGSMSDYMSKFEDTYKPKPDFVDGLRQQYLNMGGG